MADATLSQVNQVLTLIAREPDPKKSAQWLIEDWGVVRELVNSGMDQVTVLTVLNQINPYANEKVEPRYFYPEGYKPNGIEEQVRILLTRLDWLDASNVAGLASLWPEYEQADGLYIVPKPTVLAAHLGIEDPWTNFGLLIEQGPIAVLAEQRTFTNYRSGQMGIEYYRLAEPARTVLEALEADQPGDVLVFPAQTGKLYAGYSVRNSRNVIQRAGNPSQWPLTSYVVGWTLYLNGYRLETNEHLAIDCPGDEYSWSAGGQFGSSLDFRVGDGGLCLSDGLVGSTDGRFGSASAFARQ